MMNHKGTKTGTMHHALTIFGFEFGNRRLKLKQ